MKKVLIKYRAQSISFLTIALCIVTCNVFGQGEFVNPSIPPFWKTGGNTGTNAAINFIGNTDNVPLVFKVNNQPSGRIDPLLSNTFLGYWAGRDMATGTQNVAFGTNALLLNSTGTRNTAIGTSALENSTVSYNTGIGYAALQNTNTGVDNTAAGANALLNNTTGHSNTAIGRSAGAINTTGIRNTFIGDSASAGTATINNSTAIGYKARVDASNVIVLGDTVEGNRTKVGIGVTEIGAVTGITNAKLEIAMQGPTEANLLYRYAGTSGGFISSYLHSGGSLRAPATMVGDQVHTFKFKAYNGAQFIDAAAIAVELDTVQTSSVYAGRIVFSTTYNNVLKEAMRINRQGYLGVGETNPQVKLHVSNGVDAKLTTFATGFVMLYMPDTLGGSNHSSMVIDDDEIMSRSQNAAKPLNMQAEGGSIEVHTGTASLTDDFVVTNDANVRVGLGVGNTPAYQLHLATNSAAKPTSTT